MDPDDAAALREQAARWRTVAQGARTRAVRETLLKMAQELDDRADGIEGKPESP